MKFRSFLLVTFSLAVLGSLSADETKPNVLFLISDDLSTALSGFGHPQCQTPHLDRLAERGVRFENMHCQYPVCGASRASIMTGQYPYTNGTLSNTGVKRAENPALLTLPQLFRQNGYRVARVSKIYHMNIPMDIEAGDTKFDDAESWDVAINVKAPEHHAEGVHADWSPAFRGSQGFRSVEATGTDSDHADGMAADRAIEMLDQLKDDPFFLAVGFVRPHVPLVAPAKYFEMYDRGEMIAPEVPEDDLNDVPAIIRGYKAREAWGVTPELHKGLLEAYYASISYMDAQVGRVMDALDERGLTKKTIIIFTSDHGYLLGEHHKYQKQHLFEESTRVPFIFSVPWMAAQHGQATSRITELVDFFPTVTDLVGFRRPGAIQGSSLLPLLEDPDAEAWAREDAFTISRSGGESVRTEAWRFTHWGWGEKGKELYDRVNDPGEFTNLADHPDFAEVQAQMEERLLRRREAAGFRIDVHAKRKW